jgi:homoserine kinase
VTVDVPASTANLGAGFDVLALALEPRNLVHVEVLDSEPRRVEMRVTGEGAGQLPSTGRNRFVRALDAGLRAAGVHRRFGWRIEMENEIPLSRGLGSSAAATVAGLVAASALCGQEAPDPVRSLRLAAAMEGHPDNAAAALLGGFVVVAWSKQAPSAVRFDPPNGLLAVLFIPERPMSTHAMRAALPASVPFGDAVHNVGAASITVAAMASGRLDLLRAGTVDRLHEPYRASAYRELPRLTAAAREAGALGACLSGAGSTVIAFVEGSATVPAVEEALGTAAREAGLPGVVRTVRPRARGAFITRSA